MKLRMVVVAVLVSLVALSGTAFGAGFAIIEQSVTGLGNAFAGQSAGAEDATTIFYNPAGMTRLPSQQAVAGLHYIVPSAEFESSRAENVLGQPLSGGDGGDGGEPGLAPNLYYAANLDNGLALGLGVSAPFGLTTEYPRDWVGRYHAVRSKLLTININPSVAYRVTDKLSLGAGVSAQYIDVELTNMVDFGLAVTGDSGGALASNPSADIYADLEADDWGYGFNLGALYEFTPQTRVGASYRSRIKHTLKGDADFTPADQAFLASQTADIPGMGTIDLATLAAAQFPSQDIEGDITLPDSASVSFFSQVNPRWAVMADVMWTNWSLFDELVIEFDGNLPDSVTTENWDDNWRYSVGTTYTPNDTCTLRLGLAYDETPIPDQYRTPRIPGEDRIWTALGGGYRFTDNIKLDLAYVHIFVQDSKMEKIATPTNEDRSRGTVVGEFDNGVDIFSGQLTMAF